MKKLATAKLYNSHSPSLKYVEKCCATMDRAVLGHMTIICCFFPFFFLFIAIAVTRAAFGQGTGLLVLYNVGCTGTEFSLLSCSHQVVGITSCSHFKDAGVVCSTCKLYTSV